MKKYVLLNIIYGIILFFFIISLAISLPILCRFIHTLCIEPMNIVETLNTYTHEDYTKDDVIEAFDDVMDFIWKGTEFKTGKLKYSESGKSHFEDCVGLFWLDFIVLIVSSVILVALLILHFIKIIRIKNIKGFSPLFLSGIITVGLVVALGVFGLINFDLLFECFHKVFFPGKDNWVFDYRYDEVILILPEEFFMNCAIMIGSTLFILSFVSIGYGIIKKIRKGKLD